MSLIVQSALSFRVKTHSEVDARGECLHD